MLSFGGIFQVKIFDSIGAILKQNKIQSLKTSFLAFSKFNI